MFLSKLASENVLGCHILSNIEDSVSDHYPIKTDLCIMSDLHKNDETSSHMTQHVSIYPRIDWQNAKIRELYSRVKLMIYAMIYLLLISTLLVIVRLPSQR